MPAVSVRHQHRHYKTLILLVMAMTGGTFLLFWVAGLAPVTRLTPLRGETQVASGASSWDRIAVRAQAATAARGFFHWRIDEGGHLWRSRAWEARRHDVGSEGVIQVLVSCKSSTCRLTPVQAGTLAELISRLRADHGIDRDRLTLAGQRRALDD